MTISCSYKSKVVYCPNVERELYHDIKVDTLSFCIVQRRLINVLDGVVSVLVLLQRMPLPLESSDPFGLLTILEAFGP